MGFNLFFLFWVFSLATLSFKKIWFCHLHHVGVSFFTGIDNI